MGVQRNTEFKDKVVQFVSKTQGQPYRLNVQKLLGTEDEQKGYFCSELAAALYQHLGLISKKTPASQYWPGTWSRKNFEIIKEGASLGEEVTLDI